MPALGLLSMRDYAKVIRSKRSHWKRELEEVTLNEESALRARESVEATALEVDTRRWMRSYDRMMKQWQW